MHESFILGNVADDKSKCGGDMKRRSQICFHELNTNVPLVVLKACHGSSALFQKMVLRDIKDLSRSQKENFYREDKAFQAKLLYNFWPTASIYSTAQRSKTSREGWRLGR